MKAKVAMPKVHISKDKDMVAFMREVEKLLNRVKIYIPGVINDYIYLMGLLPGRVTKEVFIENVNFRIRKRKWIIAQNENEVWLNRL